MDREGTPLEEEEDASSWDALVDTEASDVVIHLVMTCKVVVVVVVVVVKVVSGVLV